jgi:hypothetical protein
MNGRNFTMIFLVTTLVYGSLVHIGHGYVLEGGRWSSANPVMYYNDRDSDGTLNKYVSYANALSSWSGVSSHVSWSGTRYGSQMAYLSWDNNPNVQWDGASQIIPSPSSNPYTSTNSYVNRHYTDGYADNERQSVMGHELGHVLGLDHYCCPAALMNTGTCGYQGRWCTYGVYAPQADDKNGVIAIYGS